MHVFLALLDPDPDPLVKGMDPSLSKKSKKWIRGSGSTPKCHGSATLLMREVNDFDFIDLRASRTYPSFDTL
jgi:hypothetical protein